MLRLACMDHGLVGPVIPEELRGVPHAGFGGGGFAHGHEA
jgi:hypothetical protein